MYNKLLMALAKGKIKKIDTMEAMKVICTGRPFGLFYVIENSRYISIDNSEGFGKYFRHQHDSFEDCAEYLLRNDPEYLGKGCTADKKGSL